MSAHVVPLYTLQKARKNGTWKLVQKGLLDLLKSGTAISIEDDDGNIVATLDTARDFANWWNNTFSE